MSVSASAGALGVLGLFSYAGIAAGLMWVGGKVLDGVLHLWMSGWLPLHWLPL